MLFLMFLFWSALLVAVVGYMIYQNIQKSVALEARVKGLGIRFGGTFSAFAAPEKKERTLVTLVQSASEAGAHFLNAVMPMDMDSRAKLALLVRRAGFITKDGLSVCLALKIIGGFLGAIACVVLALFQQFENPLLHNLAIIGAGVLGLVAGAAFPEIILEKIYEGRKVKIVRALPNALDLMIICLSTGMTFERTLQVVAGELQEFAPALADELKAVGADLRAGKRLQEVMRSLYEHTGVESLRDLGSAVVQGRKFGSSISESLEKITEIERDKMSAAIDEAVQKLPTKLTLPTIGLVVPGMMALVGGPPFMLATAAFSGG